MGLFSMFQRPDINAGVKMFRQTPGAVLLDVRTKQEYRDGHIPGSMNFPLDELESFPDKLPDKKTVLFVHCLSGARSARAVRFLKELGYSQATDIGGINGYAGKTERGE